MNTQVMFCKEAVFVPASLIRWECGCILTRLDFNGLPADVFLWEIQQKRGDQPSNDPIFPLRMVHVRLSYDTKDLKQLENAEQAFCRGDEMPN